MALDMLFGLGVFSIVFYNNATNIPKFLAGLLIVVLTFIVGQLQDQVIMMKEELNQLTNLCQNNSQKLSDILARNL